MDNIFEEVRTDYTDENGNISIDAYYPAKGVSDDEDSGKVVALVTPDGEVIDGQHPEFVTKAERNCPLVLEAIKRAKLDQEEIKQELVDKVIERLKEDFASHDYTVLDELLKFIPTKNLEASLPEEGE